MLKALETYYKGYRFRSRTEARWAIFFDVLGIDWIYEPEGFLLNENLQYMPDFWLPQQQCWYEVKGVKPTAVEERKAELLAQQSGFDVIIAWGQVGEYPDDGFYIYNPYKSEFIEHVDWDNCYMWAIPDPTQNGFCRQTIKPLPKFDLRFSESNYQLVDSEHLIENAYKIARTYRFYNKK